MTITRQLLQEHKEFINNDFREIGDQINSGPGRLTLSGLSGTSKFFIASLLSGYLNRPFIYITDFIDSLRKANESEVYIKNQTILRNKELENFPDCCVLDPPQYYWYHTALQVAPTLDDAGGMNWKIFGCLAAGWFVVYICVLKGVKSSGKVRFFFQLIKKSLIHNINKGFSVP